MNSYKKPRRKRQQTLYYTNNMRAILDVYERQETLMRFLSAKGDMEAQEWLTKKYGVKFLGAVAI